MAIRSGVNIANGVQVSITVGAIASIPPTISRFQINQASVVNSGSSIRTVNIYILRNGDSIANNFKSSVDLLLAAGESYLLYEIIGMSINAGGSIQAVVDAGTDVAMFINGAEFDKWY